MDDKEKEYKERQKNWRDISITQLSNANNILFTLSAGLTALWFDTNKPTIHIDFSGKIEWRIVAYCFTIFLISLSMLFGILVLITRLYDFRISRHLALTRKRVYKNLNAKTFSESSFPKFSSKDRLYAVWQILFKQLPFISSDVVKENDGQLEEKFESLRKLSKILGDASWRWIKVQIVSLLFSMLAFLLYKIL